MVKKKVKKLARKSRAKKSFWKGNNFWKYCFVGALILIFLSGVFLFSGEEESSEEGVVAIVNGQEILYSQIIEVQEEISSQGFNLSKEEALEQVIVKEIISQEIIKGNFSASKDDAISFVQSNLDMQGMPLEDYKTALVSQGLSYEEALEYFQEDLSYQNYFDSVLADYDLEVNDSEVMDFYEIYKSQIGEEVPSYEELKDQIIATIKQEKQANALELLIAELKSNSEIEYIN